jgi:N-methylhydantoinase A
MVMGYLNPATFAGGQMALDPEASRAVLDTMAAGLGLEPLALAAGIHRIINERMSDEIRLVSVRRGYDPRQFALVALGGAGPVHAGRLARSLSIPTVLVPGAPGVLSAFGLLVADIEHEHTRTFAVRADRVELERMTGLFAELDALGADKMAQDQVPPGDVRVARFGDLRYVGQSYELEVSLPQQVTAADLSHIVADFHEAHQRVYGHARPENPVEFVNLRTVHSAPLPSPRLAAPVAGAALDAASTGSRQAWFEEAGGFMDTPVYRRDLLPADTPFNGPAIIEQPDTTTVVYPGQTCRVDPAGNLLITVE